MKAGGDAWVVGWSLTGGAGVALKQEGRTVANAMDGCGDRPFAIFLHTVHDVIIEGDEIFPFGQVVGGV